MQRRYSSELLGTGTYQLGYARVVASWFERRLGGALSFVVAGSGVGSLFFPPLVQHLIATYGWRHTYLLLAALPLFVGAPLTLIFARSLRANPALAAADPNAVVESQGATWQRGDSYPEFLAAGLRCLLHFVERERCSCSPRTDAQRSRLQTR